MFKKLIIFCFLILISYFNNLNAQIFENWSSISFQQVYSGNVLSITYGKGKYVGFNSYTSIKSVDGVNWSESVLNNGDKVLWNLTYGNGVFVGVNYNSKILYSYDGDDWNYANVSVNDYAINKIKYVKNKFIAFGYQIVLASDDGINWIKSELPTSENFVSATYGLNQYVIVGIAYIPITYPPYYRTSVRIYVSYDAIHWSKVYEEQLMESYVYGYEIEYGNSTFILKNMSGELYISDNLVNWTKQNIGAYFHKIKFFNGFFLATAYTHLGFNIGISKDGKNWKFKKLPSDNYFFGDRDFILANDRILYISDSGMFLSQPLDLEYSVKLYNNIKNYDGIKFIKSKDSGVLGIVRAYNDQTNNNDFIILKLESGNNILWQKKFQGDGNFHISDVVETNNGYIFVGSKLDSQFSKGFAVKFDKEGVLLWKKDYDGVTNIRNVNYSPSWVCDPYPLNCVINDNYIMIGDNIIFKINDTGDIVWQKQYTGGTLWGVKKIEGGYIGYGNGIVYFNDEGGTNWKKNYYYSGRNLAISDVEFDGTFLYAKSENISYSNNSAVIMKIDLFHGNVIWSYLISNYYFIELFSCTEGVFLFDGFQKLIKLNRDRQIQWAVDTSLTIIDIFPNFMDKNLLIGLQGQDLVIASFNSNSPIIGNLQSSNDQFFYIGNINVYPVDSNYTLNSVNLIQSSENQNSMAMIAENFFYLNTEQIYNPLVLAPELKILRLSKGFRLTWNFIDDADNYEISWQKGIYPQNINESGVFNTSKNYFDHLGLTEGTYYYKVRACKNNLCGKFSQLYEISYSTYSVSVTINGSGDGKVYSIGDLDLSPIPTTSDSNGLFGIECSTSEYSCIADFNFGSKVYLKPVEEASSKFEGWSGCDEVINNYCILNINSDKNVFVSFNVITEQNQGWAKIISYPYASYMQNFLIYEDSSVLVKKYHFINEFFKLDNTGNLSWNKNINIASIIKTLDGGFLGCGGYYDSSNQSSTNIIAKFDSNMINVWIKGVSFECNKIKETLDGGYLISSYDYLVKVSSEGNIEWAKRYTNNYLSQVFVEDYLQMIDGNILLVGQICDIFSPPYYNSCRNFLLKTNSLGEKIWIKSFNINLSLNMIIPTYDNKYILSNGFSKTVKIDGNGNILLDVNDFLYPTKDGNYIVARSLTKLDSNLNKLWSKKINANDVMFLGEFKGGYLFKSVLSVNYQSSDQVILFATDYNGNILSQTGSCLLTDSDDEIFLNILNDLYLENSTVNLNHTTQLFYYKTFSEKISAQEIYNFNDFQLTNVCPISLNLIKLGNGSGSITNTKQTGSCGTVCSIGCFFKEEMTLNAVAHTDSIFTGWGGDCVSCGSNTSCNITMYASASCSATFTLKQYTITSSAIPSTGGNISCTPNPVIDGSTSTCTITPNTGYHIESVTGSCGGSLNGYTYTTNAITSDCTVEANFAINTYSIIINSVGDGKGTITSNVGGINVSYPTNIVGIGSIEHGNNIEITATADSGSTVSWNNSCVIFGGIETGNGTGVAKCTLNNVKGRKYLRVVFNKTDGVPDFISVSSGWYHNLGIKSDGSLWAWGNNEYGQLGDGTNENKSTPIRIGTDNDWIEVSAGYFHTVALKRDGSLWAWGANWSGQLGDGTTVYKTVPTRIGIDTDWVQISAGYSHTVALKRDGNLWAWGANWSGQLGDGTTVYKTVPTRIGTDTDWVQVSAGYNHTVAIKRDGSLWAWGDNFYCQLGDETYNNKNIPTRVGADNDWISVSAGGYYTVGIKIDGSLWTTGIVYSCFFSEFACGYEGLGGGSFLVRENKLLTRVNSELEWKIESSGKHHILAIKSDGSLWAWGANWSGQLGDGTIADKKLPIRIGTDTDWVQISAGGSHTLAVKSDGSLWAWGGNWSGQLGDGTTNDSYVPKQITVIDSQYNLSLSKVGTGGGTITSNPVGINCGSDCGEQYTSGTQVTLTATANLGYSFTGWGGDCVSCGTNTTCLITIDANKTCTAEFKDTTPPTAPKYIEVLTTTNPAELKVIWTNPTDADFSHIKIYRSTLKGQLGTLIADNIKAISYLDSNLASNTTYYYTLRSVDTNGNESKNTDQYSATTKNTMPCPAPTNITVSDKQTGGAVILSWVTPQCSNLSHIRIYRSNTEGQIGQKVFDNLTVNAIENTGLINNVTYYYLIKTVTKEGIESTNTQQLSVTPTAPDTTPPSSVTNVTITDTKQGGELALSWTNPVDTDFSKVYIYRSTTLGQIGALIYSGNDTTYLDKDLTNNVTYYYTFHSVDTYGNESAETTQYTGMPTDIVSPQTVKDLKAKLLTNCRVELSWTASPSKDINYYNIYTDNALGTINYTTSIVSIQHPVTKWTSPSLSCGSTYQFNVRAEDTSLNEEKNTNIVITVTPVIDPSSGFVSAGIKHPQSGQKISGNKVNVMAEIIAGSETDISEIKFQYRQAGDTNWTDIPPADIHDTNPDTTSPYFIHWDVTSLTNGVYELRAVAKNKALTVDTNPPIKTINIDNTNPTKKENEVNGKKEMEEIVNQTTQNIITTTLPQGKLELIIPEEALNSDTKIKIKEKDITSLPALPQDYINGGTIVEITFENNQTELKEGKTAKIELPYKDVDNDGVVDDIGKKAEDLKVCNYHNGSWECLDSVVDKTTKTVKAITDKFSIYALLIPPIPSGTDWNALSVPLNPSPNSATSVFNIVSDNRIFIWNAVTQNWTRVWTVNVGVGYYLRGNGANWKTSDITGTETPSQDFYIQLKKGWNLIGHPFRYKVKLSDFKITDGSTTKTILEAETSKWIVSALFYYNGSSFEIITAIDDGVIEPWKAYWILADKDITLIIPPKPIQ